MVIEAMAVGLPCVSTRVSGARELLEEPFIVPQDDPAALAAAIGKLARSKDLRMSAARRNHTHARSYANHHLQPRRNQFYQAVITGSTEPRQMRPHPATPTTGT